MIYIHGDDELWANNQSSDFKRITVLYRSVPVCYFARIAVIAAGLPGVYGQPDQKLYYYYYY